MGNLVVRAATIPQCELEEREVIEGLALRLTSCQWNMLRLLVAHPLLSDEELARLLCVERRSAHSSLCALRALGCLEPLSTVAGSRWLLCERGLHLLAAANHLSLRSLMVHNDEQVPSPPLVQRGMRSLAEHIEHTAGIYSFFVVLAQAARCQSGQRLYWWETGAVCERRYRVGEQWYNLRPDALAEWRAGSRTLRFWLQWDRGTMNARDLAVKFDAYRHYAASREWAREHSRLPRLLCVAPAIAQERRIQRVAQGRLTQSPGLVVWTTTEVLLKANGPTAPIWMRVITAHSDKHVQVSSGARRNVFDVGG